jgi:Mg-chelatase subunit ChlD
VTRDMAGRAMTYLEARTHYGVIDPAVLAPLRPIWRRVLGDQDINALDALYARLIWIADGDNAALDKVAEDYRAIIGPPPSPPGAGGRAKASDDDATAGGGGDGEEGEDGAAAPGAGSLRDALAQAVGAARDGQLEQRSGTEAPATGGSGTGAPTGRMPDRGVARPPAPDEVQASNRFANELRKAMTLGTRRIDKGTPGGRFSGRAYARGRAQRALGHPATTHPWNVIKHITSPIEEPHVLLVVDTSGSMGGYEYALGPIVWIVTDALRQIGGRVATTLFGTGCELLSDGATPMPLVPGIKTGGGTAFAGDAIVTGCQHLDMENTRRPRAVYVRSDGGWYDTESGVHKIRELKALGVRTLHISIAMAPLSVECDRISVITDPADAMDIIARDTVEALRAAARPRVRGHLTA